MPNSLQAFFIAFGFFAVLLWRKRLLHRSKYIRARGLQYRKRAVQIALAVGIIHWTFFLSMRKWNSTFQNMGPIAFDLILVWGSVVLSSLAGFVAQETLPYIDRRYPGLGISNLGICKNCGHVNETNSNFCGACGNSLTNSSTRKFDEGEKH